MEAPTMTTKLRNELQQAVRAKRIAGKTVGTTSNDRDPVNGPGAAKVAKDFIENANQTKG